MEAGAGASAPCLAPEDVRAFVSMADVCKAHDVKYRRLLKYFEGTKITVLEWSAVANEAIPTFDARDRILALMFNALVKEKYPAGTGYTIWVQPVPSDSLKPRAAVRVHGHASATTGRVGYEFHTYDAAMKARDSLTRAGYYVGQPTQPA
jgi:hypothetical protein